MDYSLQEAANLTCMYKENELITISLEAFCDRTKSKEKQENIVLNELGLVIAVKRNIRCLSTKFDQITVSNKLEISHVNVRGKLENICSGECFLNAHGFDIVCLSEHGVF